MPRHRVDSEVASREIFPQRLRKGDDGLSSVGDHVVPEGGDFIEDSVAAEYTDGSVFDAQRHGPPKQASYLLGVRPGGQIPVLALARAPAHRVP